MLTVIDSLFYEIRAEQGRSSTIQDKSGKCLTEEKEILSRWTEYCSELYKYESCGLYPAPGRRSATNPP